MLHCARSCFQHLPRQSNLQPSSPKTTQFGLNMAILVRFSSIPDPKPSKNFKNQSFPRFFHIQPDNQEASQTIENRSQKLRKSNQDRHLGCIWRPLGRHLGALGRHLGSSWGSWAPSLLILGLLGAILLRKMSQHSSNMRQDSPNSSQHRPKRPLRDLRNLNFDQISSFNPSLQRNSQIRKLSNVGAYGCESRGAGGRGASH